MDRMEERNRALVDTGEPVFALAAILEHIETTYGLREPLMRRLRGIGQAGEWIGPDSREYAVPLSLFPRPGP